MSTSTKLPSIKRAEPTDAQLVGSIIGQAFADDPLTCWILEKPAVITRMMTRLASRIYVPNGFCEYLDNEMGATMWMPPGAKGKLGVMQQLMVMADLIVSGVAGAAGRSAAFEKAIHQVKPREPHFYLFTIGVLPGGQGKGLGGTLLRSGLEQVDRASMPAYLESSKPENVPIYQRYGFEVMDAPPLPDGCPPVIPMWRPVKGRAV